jgi:hypothetical protein
MTSIEYLDRPAAGWFALDVFAGRKAHNRIITAVSSACIGD